LMTMGWTTYSGICSNWTLMKQGALLFA